MRTSRFSPPSGLNVESPLSLLPTFQKRRSSLHNLGMALFGEGGSRDQARGKARPRSKSATLRDKIIVV